MLEAGFAILAALALILLNGVWVVAEFAIVRVRRTRLEELAGQGVEAAKQAIVVVDGISDYLALTQIGITAASLAVGWIAESATERVIRFYFSAHDQAGELFHAGGIAVAFFLVTVLHVPLENRSPSSSPSEAPSDTCCFSRVPSALPISLLGRCCEFSSECRPGLSTAWGTAPPTIRRSRKMNSS